MSINTEALAAVEHELTQVNKQTEILTVPTDLSSAISVENMFRRIADTVGYADILVHTPDVDLSMGPLVAVNPIIWWRDLETNGHGTHQLIEAFLDQENVSSPKTIVSLTITSAYGVRPRLPVRHNRKALARRLLGYEEAGSNDVNFHLLHPGVLSSALATENFQQLAFKLVGGTAVWLCSRNADWLNGRFVAANWDVNELVERKDEILENGLLQIEEGGSD